MKRHQRSAARLREEHAGSYQAPVKRAGPDAPVAAAPLPAKHDSFKLTIPDIIAIACVSTILVGLVVLFIRWRAHRRHYRLTFASRADRRASYEKYGAGRGIESSNSRQSKSKCSTSGTDSSASRTSSSHSHTHSHSRSHSNTHSISQWRKSESNAHSSITAMTATTTSTMQKGDPCGSFFEVETEKPKKALFLNFRRRSDSSPQGNLDFGGPPSPRTPRMPIAEYPCLSNNASLPTPTMLSPHSAPLAPPGLAAPTPAATRTRSRSSRSFSFSNSLKKEEKERLSRADSIKSKGISAPVIVPSKESEPWVPPLTWKSSSSGLHHASMLPLPHSPKPSVASGIRPSSFSYSRPRAQTLPLPVELLPPLAPSSSTVPPVPQLLHSAFAGGSPPRFKQPQPRSPPAAPGTSQKARNSTSASDSDMNASLRMPAVHLLPSDGSLYSRNSFSSSTHDHNEKFHEYPQMSSSVGVAQSVAQEEGRYATSFDEDEATVYVTPDVTPQKSSLRASLSIGRQRRKLSAASQVQEGEGSQITLPRPEMPPFNSALNRAGALPTGSANTSMPRLMTVIAPFTPTLEDELVLKVGDIVRVIEEFQDEWCLVQMVGRIDSPRGVVPCVCLQERRRIVPVPRDVTISGVSAGGSIGGINQWW